jgi:hypothetical protein
MDAEVVTTDWNESGEVIASGLIGRVGSDINEDFFTTLIIFLKKAKLIIYWQL